MDLPLSKGTSGEGVAYVETPTLAPLLVLPCSDEAEDLLRRSCSFGGDWLCLKKCPPVDAVRTEFEAVGEESGEGFLATDDPAAAEASPVLEAVGRIFLLLDALLSRLKILDMNDMAGLTAFLTSSSVTATICLQFSSFEIKLSAPSLVIQQLFRMSSNLIL